MTELVWDQIGERFYQTGVDRGVLFLQEGKGVVWNGLTSVEDTSTAENKAYYLEGVKYLNVLVPGDYTGKLKAFTYPDEFDGVNGIEHVSDGLAYYSQPPKSFNLTYRTRIGSDLDGLDHGYKIHLLYNLLANPDTYAFETIRNPSLPIEFSWALTGTPPKVKGTRPTVHISISSIDTDPDILELIENILYGTADSDPRFPSINEIADYFGYYGALIIVDNGDGTWTAIDEGDSYITMINATTFQIDNADATYLDATTYQISTTNAG
jgi:hypothetical protein